MTAHDDDDEVPKTLRRARSCGKCPLKGDVRLEQLKTLCGGGTVLRAELLCLDSGCLEGSGKDFYCRGFELNVARLKGT